MFWIVGMEMGKSQSDPLNVFVLDDWILQIETRDQIGPFLNQVIICIGQQEQIG